MIMRIKDGIGIAEAKCYRCGKIYVEQPAHIFKHGSKHFCCWTCYNAHLNEIESKKGARRR